MEATQITLLRPEYYQPVSFQVQAPYVFIYHVSFLSLKYVSLVRSFRSSVGPCHQLQILALDPRGRQGRNLAFSYKISSKNQAKGFNLYPDEDQKKVNVFNTISTTREATVLGNLVLDSFHRNPSSGILFRGTLEDHIIYLEMTGMNWLGQYQRHLVEVQLTALDIPKVNQFFSLPFFLSSKNLSGYFEVIHRTRQAIPA